jgi:hypothetical protein
MKDIIAGDIITKARRKRGDVRIEPGARGGVSFRTLSHLDVLLEADIITQDQFQAGMLYWRLREVMTRIDNPLFADVIGEHDEHDEPFTAEEITIDDPETFLALICTHIPEFYRKALDAACAALAGPKFILVHAVGENRLLKTFDYLEEAITKAHEEMKNRLQRSASMLASGVESCV